MKKSGFLSKIIVSFGWLALMAAGGEFAVFLPEIVEGLIRVFLLAVFCWTQVFYIRLNKKMGARI